MMDALLIAGKRLADALRAENEALSKLDLSRAAKLAESKIAATDAFAQAYAAQAKHGARPDGALREEAQTILASYERKQKDVQAQADRIVATAREEAMTAAAEAKEELKASITRRLAAAEDRIASAEAAALRAVREQAVSVAVAAAGDLLAKQMSAEGADAMIEASIKEVGERLH
jgi:F-type H+-transporting ATPase subunit b